MDDTTPPALEELGCIFVERFQYDSYTIDGIAHSADGRWFWVSNPSSKQFTFDVRELSETEAREMLSELHNRDWAGLSRRDRELYTRDVLAVVSGPLD